MWLNKKIKKIKTQLKVALTETRHYSWSSLKDGIYIWVVAGIALI